MNQLYELEDEEPTKQQLDRKLGAVSYIKWGQLYNYQFSFDLKKGRLLCYKTIQSKDFNNYYSLNHGEFVNDEARILEFEQQLRKKKNYQESNSKLIYVRTQKGRIFKLIVSQDYDKILGYLQICFQSKQDSVNAFYALLGVGSIELNNYMFKLTTGIVVKLNWQNTKQDGYLGGQQQSWISNIELLGGIIASFYAIYDLLAIVYNPESQSLDVILFDPAQQPKAVHFDIFKVVKLKKKVVPSGKTQLLKLNTNFQVDDLQDYIQIAQNENIKIYCKKESLNVADYELVQGGMFKAKSLDDGNEMEADKLQVTQALSFYRQKQKPNNIDDTKEFIVVHKMGLIKQQVTKSAPPKRQVENSVELDNINEESCEVQVAKTINVHMGKYRNSIGGGSLQDHSLQNTPKHNHGDNQFQDDRMKFDAESLELEQQEQQEQQQMEINRQGDQGQQFQDIQLPPLNGSQIHNDDDEDIDLIKYSIVFDSAEHCPLRDSNAILQYSSDFTKIDAKDEYRVAIAHKKGGTECADKKMIELTRSVGKYMIKQIGQKLLSGNFNLTTVSFPIKAMIPKSALEKTFMQTILFPLYLNKAACISNPVERIKLTAVALISNYIQANSFLKPLNPILGETFEGGYEDGTQLYCEQISHHPPVSYFLVYGPKKSYKMYGYSLYEAKAGLNSLTIINNGKRFVHFDNQKLSINFSQEHYSGTFFGTLKHESAGQLNIIDEANNLQLSINLGKVKNKPTDYVDGEIKSGKQVLAKMYGSYMGFIEFDGVRYWDARFIKPFAMTINKSYLESDHTKRTDRILMLTGDMEKAQLEKERLEGAQRNEANLRKEYLKNLTKQQKKKK